VIFSGTSRVESACPMLSAADCPQEEYDVAAW
jgi:hypothetical protein